MRIIALFFCFVTLFCMKDVRALQVDYIDSFKIRIDLSAPSSGYFSSGILKSHSGLSYPGSFNKTFNVSAPPGYSLVVSIRLIDLRPSRQDELKIFATNGQVSPVSFVNSGFFKNRRFYPREDLTFFAPNGQVGIRFTTGPSYLTYGYDGFELVYTVVGNGFLCYSDNFRCNNGRCIANELACDGHNHCGDQSSEKHCFENTGSGRKVGIALGVIFLVIAAVCGIFIGIRKARRDTTDVQIVTSHPPPTNLPSYPPAYPQPGTYYPPPPPPYSQGVANPTYH